MALAAMSLAACRQAKDAGTAAVVAPATARRRSTSSRQHTRIPSAYGWTLENAVRFGGDPQRVLGQRLQAAFAAQS